MYGNKCDRITAKQTRKIKPTRKSVSGIYIFREENPIEFESTLERDFIMRHEFSLKVLDIIPQPCTIPFTAPNGAGYHYTPDFLVYYRAHSYGSYNDYPRPILVEVKPENLWRKHWKKWLPKWKAAWRHAQNEGWLFHICDEARIRDQALENIRFLRRYQRMQFPEEESEWILKTVRKLGIVEFHHLLARHFMGSDKAQGISHIWHLLSTRRLDCDINIPLSNNTELWIAEYE